MGRSVERPADAAFSRGRFLFGSFVSGRRHGMEVENGASPLKKSGPMLDAERLRRRCQKVAREKKLAPSRRPHPGLRRNVEHLRAALKLAKYGGIGAGEKHLAAEAGERVIKRGAAARIEMGGDLVEKRERRNPRHLGGEARMGERESNDQRLLLAGRGRGRRRLFRPVPDQKIGKMRADERAAGRGVAAAIVAQARPVTVFRPERRAAAGHGFDFALKCELRPRKRRRIVATRYD